MDLRRPGTAFSRRPITPLPFLVLQLRSKPVNNPLLAAPSRSLLVRKRPSHLRQTASSYPLLTTSCTATSVREQEDSSVLVNPLELEGILAREDANKYSRTCKQGAEASKMVLPAKKVSKKTLPLKLRIQAALAQIGRELPPFGQQSQSHHWAFASNESLETETDLEGRNPQFRMFQSSKQFLMCRKSKKRQNSGKIDIYFPTQTAVCTKLNS